MNKEKYVKDYIAESLFQLMQKKQYSKITITEIVNHAGVERKSFYKNYSNKENILTEKIKIITDEFLTEINIKEFKYDLKKNFVVIFNHMKKQDSIVKLFYKNDLMYLIENVFIDTVIKLNQDLPKEYAYFIAGGYYNLYYYWLENNYKENPEELSN